MKTLLLKFDYDEATVGLEGEFPDPCHVHQMLRETTRIIRPDGTVTAILLRGVIPTALHKLAYQLLRSVDERQSNRAVAAGAPPLPRVNKNGTVGPRRVVPIKVLDVLQKQGVRQGVLGYLDATAGLPCHGTPLTVRHPEMLDGNRRLIELVDILYKKYVPILYAKQSAEVETVPRWRLWNTAFTTIYVAKNFRTAYHIDSGNLPGVFSALMPMGDFTGGELVLPRWRIGFAFKPGDLLLFDPQQLHGNLPISGERVSAVFYCERRIAECGKRGRRRR